MHFNKMSIMKLKFEITTLITGKSWSWIKARCSAIKESSNAIVYGVPFRKNILHFAHKMMRHHLVFVDMKNFFFQHQLFSCLHETIFHATSTRFCWHQITFCATSNLLFQHKITFRAQSRVFFRHFEIRKKKKNQKPIQKQSPGSIL